MAGELAIEVRQLVKQFGGQVTAMDQLNLSVPSGETDGLLGPNGAVGRLKRRRHRAPDEVR